MKSLMVIVPIVFGFACTVSTSAQAPSGTNVPLSFEVVSIKPGDTTDPRGIRGGTCRGVDTPNLMANGPIVVPMGRCRFIGATLKFLIAAAYGIDIEGGPGWMDADHFEIEGAASDPSTVTRPQLIQMLQQLLADRFKLKVHRRTKEISGYELVVAKSGPKLKDAAPGGRNGTSSAPGKMTGRGVVSNIASVVSRSLGSPVIDNTGLKGIYDIDLQWAPDSIGAGPTTLATDPSGPSIFTAVQEQLGLRLDPKKIVVEVLVVDSAEKPAGN